MLAFTIGGVVLEAATRRPLGGWYVEACEGPVSIALGSAVTAEDGTFRVDCGPRESQIVDLRFRLSRRPGGTIVHETAGFDGGGSHHEILVPHVGAERPRLTEGGLPG